MKKFLLNTIIMTVLITSKSYAHLLPGVYRGLDQNNLPCQFTVAGTWYEDDIKHPLRERIPVLDIKFHGTTAPMVIWNLYHPTSINYHQTQINLNHEMFHEIVATQFGASSVTLLKNESENHDSLPTKLILIETNFQSKKSSSKVCHIN